MAGYWIVRAGEVTDADAQRSYGKAWAPLAERYGAKIIAGPSPIATKRPGRSGFHCAIRIIRAGAGMLRRFSVPGGCRVREEGVAA